MDSNLKIQIVNSVPKPLYDKNLIKILIDFYFDVISDVQKILEDPIQIYEDDFLAEEYIRTNNEEFEKVRVELLRTHLEELYKITTEIESSEEVYNKFVEIRKSLGIDNEALTITTNISTKLDNQYIHYSKIFKTRKGTAGSLYFMYDLINKSELQPIGEEDFFEIIEGTTDRKGIPFHYTIKSTLYEEVYEETIKPLTHPVGFILNYEKVDI